MKSLVAALIHSRFQQRTARAIPAARLAAATIVAAVLLFTIGNTAFAEGPPSSGGTSGCADLQALTLTPGHTWSSTVSRESSSGDCGFQASVGPRADASGAAPPGAGASGAASTPCQITFTPSAIGSTGMRVAVTHSGDCSTVTARWQIRPPAPSVQGANGASGAGGQASASTWSLAYAYLLGEDAVGVDMIKNRSQAGWNHDTQRVLSVNHDPILWGTPHEIRILGRRLGDGWTIESSSSGTVRHGDAHVEAWNAGNFHVHVPLLPDPRARTRSELHVEANAAFYCDFELQWTNSYAFTSESTCAKIY